MEKEGLDEKTLESSITAKNLDIETIEIQEQNQKAQPNEFFEKANEEDKEGKAVEVMEKPGAEIFEVQEVDKGQKPWKEAEKLRKEMHGVQESYNKEQPSEADKRTNRHTLHIDDEDQSKETKSFYSSTDSSCPESAKRYNEFNDKLDKNYTMEAKTQEEANQRVEKVMAEAVEEHAEPVFDGTESPDLKVYLVESTCSLENQPEADGQVWPEKAAALKNFVREKSVVAVSTVLRRLSGKKNEGDINISEDHYFENGATNATDIGYHTKKVDDREVPTKSTERSAWNPLSYIRVSHDNTAENKEHAGHHLAQPNPMKGQVVLYTRLGCQDCKAARLFLRSKRLSYVEINIDVYPSRKLELERVSGSSTVPKVFFNKVLIGGLNKMRRLDESGELEEKLSNVITEAPSSEAPLPPLSGEDDVSSSGTIDELAVIVRKMREAIVIKDRFYRMRWFKNSFTGSEAVDFISDDQYLEREEAVEFAAKLASEHFFHNILDENIFDDGNNLYRFLDHDPTVMSQCFNISRGIIDVKPKPITEIASRLRFLSCAIFEAYSSEDGKHVDYRSIHGSEEFARYLRIVEELQRVDLQDMPREEKLSFFINLYNMMTIHAILVWGHPVGALDRRRLFGDFKYVIGGCTYSLSAIQNGILRGNQRPPYNLMKPFGMRDRRSRVALPYSEPLVHFAMVCGTRSGPSLRCYSPGNIDRELMEAARNFLRGGGLLLDLNAKAASVNKILKWYSVDFGKNEVEVLKHAANYLEPTVSECLLESLASSQLKVAYQPYDWGLNC